MHISIRLDMRRKCGQRGRSEVSGIRVHSIAWAGQGQGDCQCFLGEGGRWGLAWRLPTRLDWPCPITPRSGVAAACTQSNILSVLHGRHVDNHVIASVTTCSVLCK